MKLRTGMYPYRIVSYLSSLLTEPLSSWMGNLVTNRTWEHFW